MTSIQTHGCVVVQLFLKLNAQVFLNRNLDVRNGLVNGSRGIVTACVIYLFFLLCVTVVVEDLTENFAPLKKIYRFNATGIPTVRFLNGIERMLYPEEITAVGAPGLSRKQIPLELAWAISIHKVGKVKTYAK